MAFLLSLGVELGFSSLSSFRSTLRLEASLWRLGTHIVVIDFGRQDLIIYPLLVLLISRNFREYVYSLLIRILTQIWSLRRTYERLLQACLSQAQNTGAPTLPLSPADFSRIESSRPRQVFQYHALQGSKDIRLLYLLRGSGNDIIRISICHASLKDRPKYLALSYVWGAEPADVPISLNGHEWKIRPRLAAALRLLRQDRGREQALPLWVDALCINQSDIAERNEQVPLMRSIYENAYKVKVWLGEPDERTELAAAKLKSFEALMISIMCGEGRDQHGDRGHGMKNIPPIMFALFGEPGSMSAQSIEEFRAIHHLFDSAWFRRAWVVQEVTMPDLSKVELVIGRSGQTIPFFATVFQSVFLLHLLLGKQELALWQGLSGELQRLYSAFKPALRFLQAKLLISKSGRYQYAWNYLHSWASGASRNLRTRYVLAGLDLLRDYEATDPSDKVYIPLGLTSSYNSILRPNYDRTVQETYTGLVVSLLERRRNLDILSCCAGDKSPDLPSWVPDWRRTVKTTSLTLRFGNDHHHIFRASRREAPDYSLSDDLRQLRLRGSQISTIEKILTFDDVHTASWQAELDGLLEHLPVDYCGSGYSTRQALCHTIVSDHVVIVEDKTNKLYYMLMDLTGQNSDWDMNPTQSPSNLAANFYRTILLDGGFDARTQVYKRGAELSQDDLSSLADSSDHPSRSPSAHGAAEWDSFYRSTKGRVLFVTQDGHLGLAPEAARPDDVVAVLLGGHTPFVVRKAGCQGHDMRWTLVGEAYVHGLMDGEAMDRDGEPKERELFVFV